MLLTCLLPFLATEGSRVLEKKENETQVSKLCSATLSISKHTFCQHTRYTFIQYWVGNALQGNFKYGCFWMFCDRRETLLPCFDSYFSRQKRKKTRLTVVFTLIYCVTDFMTVSMRNISAGQNDRESGKASNLLSGIPPGHVHDDRRWSYRLVNENFYYFVSLLH